MLGEDDWPRPLALDTPRAFDDDYRTSIADYMFRIQSLLRLLAIRASPDVRAALARTPIRVVNRGRTEAFVIGTTIHVDVAFLDLLGFFAFEQAVGEVKSDSFHVLEFHVAYAAALATNRRLDPLEVYNTAALSVAQFRRLWNETQVWAATTFDSILGFVLAHELGHLVLRHATAVDGDPPGASGAAGGALRRRELELEADRFAASLCLDALLPPAHMVAWFHSTELRRLHYGFSGDYPSPKQRDAAIQSVYADRLPGYATMPWTSIPPLPPDRDMAQVDPLTSLRSVREVRQFRQQLVCMFDGYVDALLQSGEPLSVVAALGLDFIEGWRRLLEGVPNSAPLSQALALIDRRPSATPDIAELGALVDQAGLAPPAVELLRSALSEPVDWDTARGWLELACHPRQQFALGVELDYVLANTKHRWDVRVFAALRDAAPADARRVHRLKPHALEGPLSRQRLGLEERIAALKQWDGVYPIFTEP